LRGKPSVVPFLTQPIEVNHLTIAHRRGIISHSSKSMAECFSSGELAKRKHHLGELKQMVLRAPPGNGLLTVTRKCRRGCEH
jgi:hypothetical protein